MAGCHGGRVGGEVPVGVKGKETKVEKIQWGFMFALPSNDNCFQLLLQLIFLGAAKSIFIMAGLWLGTFWP